MVFEIYTDGGAINNPGPAAIAFVVFSGKKLVFKFSQSIGSSTNNFAEYTALVNALEWVKNQAFGIGTKIFFFSDSRLMVNQVNGLFKVKNSDIRNFILKIRVLEQEIGAPIIYKNIPREENSLADSLVKRRLTLVP